jgi:hypothetical protein
MKKALVLLISLVLILGCTTEQLKEEEKLAITIDTSSNIEANISYRIRHHCFFTLWPEITFFPRADYDQNAASVQYTWDNQDDYGNDGTRDTLSSVEIGVDGFMPALQLSGANTTGYWESAWMDMATGSTFKLVDDNGCRCDTVTGWAHAADAIAEVLNTTDEIEGTGCLDLGLSVSVSGETYGRWTLTLEATTDLSETDTMHIAIFVATGIKADMSSTTPFRVRVRDSSSNTSEATIAAASITENQWNFITIDRADFSDVGAATDWTDIDSFLFYIYEDASPSDIASGDVRIDEIFFYTEGQSFVQYPDIFRFLEDQDVETTGYKVMFTSDFTARYDNQTNGPTSVDKVSDCTNITATETLLNTLVANHSDMEDDSNQRYRYCKVRIDLSRSDTDNEPRVYSCGVGILGRKETVITSEHGEYDLLTYRAEEEHKGDILEFQKPLSWSVTVDNADGRFNTDKPDSPYNLSWSNGKSSLADKTGQVVVYKDTEKDYIASGGANSTIYRKRFFTGYLGSSPKSQANALEGIERDWDGGTVKLSGTGYVGKYVKNRSLARVPGLQDHMLDEIVWLYAWYAGLPSHRFDVSFLLYPISYISPKENDLYDEIFHILHSFSNYSFNGNEYGTVKINKSALTYPWAISKDFNSDTSNDTRIFSLCHDSTNDVLIAGGWANGKIWKSKDKGRSWTLKKALDQETPAQLAVLDIVYDPTNDVLIAGTYPDGQLWKSTDAGETWTLKKDLSNETPSQTYIYTLCHDVTNDVLLAGTRNDGQIWKSSDAGENWTLKKDLSNESPSQTRVQDIIHDVQNDVLLAGTFPDAQIWKSSDAGENWTLKKDLGNETPAQSRAMCFAHDSVNDILICGTWGDGQLWASSDAGENWTLKKDLNADDESQTVVYDLTFDSANGILIASTAPNAQIWLSGDAGETWKIETDFSEMGPGQGIIYRLAYDTTNELLLAGTGQNALVYISTRDLVADSSYVFDTQGTTGGAGRHAIDITSVDDFSKKVINGVQVDAKILDVSGDQEVVYEWIDTGAGDTKLLSGSTIVVMTKATLEDPIDDGTEEADFTRVQLEVRKSGGTLYTIDNHNTDDGANPTKGANGYEVEYFHCFGKNIYLAFDVDSSDVTLDVCRAKGYIIFTKERLIGQYPPDLDVYDIVYETNYFDSDEIVNDAARRLYEAQNKSPKLYESSILDGIPDWIDFGYAYLHHTVGDEETIAQRVKCLSASLDQGEWSLSLVEYNDEISPSPVTGFSSTRNGADIDLAWTNPTDADFSQVVIRSRADFSPTDITDGTDVYVGTGTSHSHTIATAQYYSIWALDSSGNKSKVANDNAGAAP